MEILSLSITRLCSGKMWAYLTARITARVAVQIEQERNHATVEAIRALPPGSELYESEVNGRTRVIRIPALGPPIVLSATLEPPAASRDRLQ